MRKIRIAAAALALAGASSVIPISAAQASPSATAANACENIRDNNWGDGNFRAYRYTYCSGWMGTTPSWDSHWGNNSGPFRGNEDDAATSLVNTGADDPNGLVAVRFWSKKDYKGGYLCIRQNDYVDNLARDINGNVQRMTNGSKANNNITSHEWVTNGACHGHWAW
ncbi:hypothetical protein [Streptomyces sp. PR69]|uniref:hypothetical protein n=1 Tax=Streptomyces sp. PR69 TaxID=2984950 RepID=UPI002263EBDF|nr:hypothetical protein [Streptomyces sp. PR69]